MTPLWAELGNSGKEELPFHRKSFIWTFPPILNWINCSEKEMDGHSHPWRRYMSCSVNSNQLTLTCPKASGPDWFLWFQDWTGSDVGPLSFVFLCESCGQTPTPAFGLQLLTDFVLMPQLTWCVNMWAASPPVADSGWSTDCIQKSCCINCCLLTAWRFIQ